MQPNDQPEKGLIKIYLRWRLGLILIASVLLTLEFILCSFVFINLHRRPLLFTEYFKHPMKKDSVKCNHPLYTIWVCYQHWQKGVNDVHFNLQASLIINPIVTNIVSGPKLLSCSCHLSS